MTKRNIQTLSGAEQIYLLTRAYVVDKQFKRWFTRFAHVPPLFRGGFEKTIVRLTIAANLSLIDIGFTPRARTSSFYSQAFLEVLINNQLRNGKTNWNAISNDDGTSDVINGLHQILLALKSSNLQARFIADQFIFDLNIARDDYLLLETIPKTALMYVTKHGFKLLLQHLTVKP